MGLLSAALIDQTVAMDTALIPDDFSMGTHQIIWRAMKAMVRKGIPTNDPLLVEHELQSVPGGTSVRQGYIKELAAYSDSAVRAAEYSNIIREMAIRAKTIDNAEDARKLAQDMETPIDDLLDRVEQRTYALRARTAQHLSFEMMIDTFIGNVEAGINTYSQGVSWGLPSLDDAVLTMQPGNIYTVGARPGVGKSWLALNAMLQAAKRGDGILFFSLDEPAQNQVIRLLAIETGISTRVMKQGAFDELQKRRIIEAANMFKALPMEIEDSRGISVETLISKARVKGAEIMRKGASLKVVMIDYVQLISDNEAKNGNEKITKSMERIRVMTGRQELDCAAVVISQLSRESVKRDDKRPRLEDLRESGSIEQESDVVIMPFRESMYKEEKESSPWDVMELIVAKNRHGSLYSPKGLPFAWHQWNGRLQEPQDVVF